MALDAAGDMGGIDRNLLRRNYLVRALSREVVAGRSARHVAVRHRRTGAGLDLWVDEETGFPLRTVTVDQRGSAVTDTTYEEIRAGKWWLPSQAVRAVRKRSTPPIDSSE